MSSQGRRMALQPAAVASWEAAALTALRHCRVRLCGWLDHPPTAGRSAQAEEEQKLFLISCTVWPPLPSTPSQWHF